MEVRQDRGFRRAAFFHNRGPEMTKQALIYERPRPVANERHKGWSVEEGGNFGFARDLNAVPLVIEEFGVAAREYPIVFSEAEGIFAPAALVGLRDYENLFVDDDGRWNADYLPAFVRRYPFVFAHDAKAQTYTLCIDEASELCNEDGRGKSLFDEAGKASPYLQKMANLLTKWQRAMQESQAFCARLHDLQLLHRSEIKFKLEGDKQAVTGGFLAVDRDRLRELPAEAIVEMHQNGDLEMIYAHLVSLHALESLRKTLDGRPPPH